MRAALMLARSELRRRWRSVVVLTLLVVCSGAVVLALVAGARRTETSLARFERESRSADVEVDAGDTTPAQLAAFRRVPGVAAVAELHQLTLVSRESAVSNQFLPSAAQVDTRFGTVVDRARVVSGRAAHLDAVDELTVGEGLASLLHVGVGDRLRFSSYSPADVRSPSAGMQLHGPDVTFRIVGIVRRPLDLGGRGAAGGVIVPTPAFLARYRDQIGSFSGSVLRVRAVHGSTDVVPVVRAARRIFGASGAFGFTNLSVEGQGAQNAIDVTTVGLYTAAAVAALTAIVGIAIALSREIAFGDANQLTLSALGLRPRHRVLGAAALGVPIALVGAVGAVVGAVVASPIFPIGVAANAEPDPGLRFDGLAIGVGFLGVEVVVLAVAVIAGLRTARATRAPTEAATPSLAARATAQTGAPPPVAVGVRFALDRGRQRHALPVRSSLLGATFGVLVVVAVLMFSVGLHHLVTTPARYGWTWDLVGYDTRAQTEGGDCGPLDTQFVANRRFAAVASVCSGSVEVAGHPVTGWGFRQLRGNVQPEIVSGRAPRTLGEVALGADTLAAAGQSVGGHVRIVGETKAGSFRIVGQAVFAGVSDPQPLADSAVFTAAALDRLGANGGWYIVLKLTPGTDRAAMVRQQRRSADFGGPVTPTLPAEIDRVRQIGGLPVVLAVFVALVALVAVGLALVSSLRRRRREFAVLKTLGFTRRQVRATVACQASAVATFGLFVGIPLGLLVGTFVWRAVADQLGISGDPTWPVLGVLLLVPAAIVAVNLVAAVPAARAARTRPAVVLRSE
ncbi:MAG: putative transport system permease protein [Actinomycetota bacterium]|jgi:ABC-type lipoprotein release transport system permease subunit|nr:putative transport system permease protein [Actinomycetota bacterium]